MQPSEGDLQFKSEYIVTGSMREKRQMLKENTSIHALKVKEKQYLIETAFIFPCQVAWDTRWKIA